MARTYFKLTNGKQFDFDIHKSKKVNIAFHLTNGNTITLNLDNVNGNNIGQANAKTVKFPPSYSEDWTPWYGVYDQYGFRNHKAGTKNRFVYWTGLVVRRDGVLIPKSQAPKNEYWWDYSTPYWTYGSYVYQMGSQFNASGDTQWWQVRRRPV